MLRDCLPQGITWAPAAASPKPLEVYATALNADTFSDRCTYRIADHG